MNAVLAADSVGKQFRGRKVLTMASVWVRAGRISALSGRNGCGKTTLLRIICGFVRADHGTVTFRGRQWLKPALHRLAAGGLFFIPERDLLSRGRTVRAHFDALCHRFECETAGHVLEAMRIEGLLDRPPERLSTGERRRAEMALALVRRPVCLIADEPFLGLAPRDAAVIVNAIRSLAADGAAVLLTGHEIETLLDVADDVTWMTAGTTHPLGSPAEARNHDQFRREYLGPGRGGSSGHAPGHDPAFNDA